MNGVVTEITKVTDAMFDIEFPLGTPVREFLEGSRNSKLRTAAENGASVPFRILQNSTQTP